MSAVCATKEHNPRRRIGVYHAPHTPCTLQIDARCHNEEVIVPLLGVPTVADRRHAMVVARDAIKVQTRANSHRWAATSTVPVSPARGQRAMMSKMVRVPVS